MTHPKTDARGSFEVITPERQRAEPGKVIVTALAGLFFLICTWTSYARWANFQYRSFDLAYYVQAIWQLIHGRLGLSVENVPLLGNHVERSEEHTSELQSRFDLVCRLLLEKKNRKIIQKL